MFCGAKVKKKGGGGVFRGGGVNRKNTVIAFLLEPLDLINASTSVCGTLTSLNIEKKEKKKARCDIARQRKKERKNASIDIARKRRKRKEASSERIELK